MATIGQVQVVGTIVNTSGSGTGTAYTVPTDNYAVLTLSAQITTGASLPYLSIYALINGVRTLLFQTTSTTPASGTWCGALLVYVGSGASISFDNSAGVAISWSVSGVTYLKANYP